jgi:hypothetical protein
MKKKISKVLCQALAAGLVLTMFQSMSIDADAATRGSTIECRESGNELPNNVERGSCPYTWVTVTDSSCQVLWPTGSLYSIMYDLRYYSNGNNFRTDALAGDGYVFRQGCGENRSLLASSTFEDSLRATLENARNSGTSLILRFSYAKDKTVGNEPSLLLPGDDTTYHNTEQIRTHIKEISGILNDYTDVVLAVECGMFGPWGEMHSSMYDIDACNGYDAQFSNAIINRWLEKLNPQIKVLVRAPKHLMGYYGYNDSEAFNNAVNNNTLQINPRLGMYNDGYLGDSTDVGTYGSSNSWPYIKRANCQKLLEKMTTVPFGGECAYVSDNHLATGGTTMYGGADFTAELYKSHLSYLHNINNTSEVVIGALNRVNFESNCLIPGLERSDVEPYIGHSYRKFIRDHMGYRLLVKESQMSQKASRGGSFNMSGKIKNVGFGNFLTPKTTEIILKKGSTTKVIPVDFDATEITSLTTVNYSFDVPVSSSLSTGEWDVYMRIRSNRANNEASVKTGIRFANPCDFDTTIYANKIGTIKIN